MLMLCLAIRPPEAPVLDMFKNSRNQTVKILVREPGDIGLAPEPGLLSLREAASRSDRLTDCLLKRPFPLQVPDELSIPDGLERGQLRIQTLSQQPGHLFYPAFLHHTSHAARDLIV